MKIRTALGLAVLASSTTIALAQPGGGRPGGGRQGGPPDPQQFIDRMMERDANGDGMLSKDELDGPFGERLFESDANGDGMLSREELTAAMEQMRQRFAERGGQPGGQPGGEGGPGAGAGGGFRGAGVPMGEPAALNFDQGMQMAGRALRQLRRSEFNDESRADDLRAIASIQAGLIAAKARAGTVPMAPQAEERYGDDEVKYESDFRLTLIQAIMESLALEMSVIEGDTAGAKAALEHLMEAQKQGHDAFEHEEEDEGEDAIPEPRRGRPGGEDGAPQRGRPDRDG